MTLPNQMRDGDWGVGVMVSDCVGVCGGKRVEKKGGEVGEDEKTWGASFEAVNVQIYVEGQWSTFIISPSLPTSYPSPAAHSNPVSSQPAPSFPIDFLFSVFSTSSSPTLSPTIIPPFSPIFPRLSSLFPGFFHVL